MAELFGTQEHDMFGMSLQKYVAAYYYLRERNSS